MKALTQKTTALFPLQPPQLACMARHRRAMELRRQLLDATALDSGMFDAVTKDGVTYRRQFTIDGQGGGYVATTAYVSPLIVVPMGYEVGDRTFVAETRAGINLAVDVIRHRVVGDTYVSRCMTDRDVMMVQDWNWQVEAHLQDPRVRRAIDGYLRQHYPGLYDR